MFAAMFGMLVEQSKDLSLQHPEVVKLLDVLSFFTKHTHILEVS